MSSKTIEHEIVTGSNNKKKPLCHVRLQLLLVLSSSVSSSVLQIFDRMIVIGLTSSLKSSTVLANLFLTFLLRVAACRSTTKETNELKMGAFTCQGIVELNGKYITSLCSDPLEQGMISLTIIFKLIRSLVSRFNTQ